jgi:hypothetical protein
MKTISATTPTQSVRLAKAAAVTKELVQYAKLIRDTEFAGHSSDLLLPSLIQALATNYAAQVAAVKD